MPALRSRLSTHGRNMAGARGLWRATGMKDGDFGKPIIAIANSFTQFVPGHVHLKDLGQLVAGEIHAAGGVAKEFNTIAVDDGIAMGHDGMLYSLPSRDLIADSVEFMVNAHCADVLVSEPMGTLLLNERMLESYVFARDTLLKPGGRMFPVREFFEVVFEKKAQEKKNLPTLIFRFFVFPTSTFFTGPRPHPRLRLLGRHPARRVDGQGRRA